MNQQRAATMRPAAGRDSNADFFFFKQKTAYEISACLVGSEMCIRDSCKANPPCVNAGFGIYYISMEKSACGQEELPMKLMVIDGNSILNRAYYGIRPLTTRDGLYTHAIFGFLTTLLRLEGEEAPDALCVTFDVHAPTFRHQASEAYKATRKPMPEELRVQVPVLKEVLDALNIPRYEQEGWEADDLIGTISRKCEADGWDCVCLLYTSDAADE